MSDNIYKVSEILNHLKSSLNKSKTYNNISIVGEISNFYNNNHIYFSLKDEYASIKCAFFKNRNKNIDKEYKNGDKVILTGDLSIYLERGDLNFIVNDIKEHGLGDLNAQFLKLKDKLFKQGLFDIKHKKILPKYPMDIAIITGLDSAAYNDIKKTLNNRWPIAKIKYYFSLVQGNEASNDIINNLLLADNNNHELIVLSRGGGSIEDLSVFNNEALALTIFNLKTPIITGIGHEPDITIADYVADKVAPTPTGSIINSTPNIIDVYKDINDSIRYITTTTNNKYKQYNNDYLYNSKNISNSITIKLNNYKQLLNKFNTKLYEYHTILYEYRADIYKNHHKIINNIKLKIYTKKQDISNILELLDAYSPIKVLKRGYTLVYKQDKIIKTIKDLKVKDIITLKLNDGQIKSIVKEIHNER